MDNMMRCYIILYNVITEGCDSLRCDLVCYQVTAECHKGERGTLKAHPPESPRPALMEQRLYGNKTRH